MMRPLHPLLQEYVNRVCGQVKARELCQEIKEELSGHLDELWESMRAEGLDEDTAAQRAIARMGDSESVAQGLNRVHKPRIPWALLCTLALLLTIALIAVYAVQLSYNAGNGFLSDADLFVRQTIFMGLGLAVLFALSRIHYRKLSGYSSLIYGLSVMLILAAHLGSQQINGARGYILGGINLTALCPYLFTVAAAGYFSRRVEAHRNTLWMSFVFGILPLLLFASIPSFANLIFYAVTFSLMLCFSRQGWRWVTAYLSLVTAAFLLPILLSDGGQNRLFGFILRNRDPEGAGYIYLQIEKAVRSAGWQGHGFGLPMQELPAIHSESLFTYLIYTLGWTFGLIVLAGVLLFIYQLAKAAMTVRENYGKMLIAGLGSLFAVQFAWSVGMSLGILPVSKVQFPLIGYGGSGLLAQMAAIGLIYSVYRRKDMVRVGG
ncbi:FtsW/RodA/SpoVE family cell cycle protein [Paenibacillus phocaensis]|uniref:FtsW/RodA/SpoVE family cell cycle protein n=1 Tax=Paenibacillus phocaensis TaxID=1776378 RepID=UPI000839CA80|nr:FtsW/RodA/SpoVE family cell cycle protein [Paenibacillus phocaensis]